MKAITSIRFFLLTIGYYWITLTAVYGQQATNGCMNGEMAGTFDSDTVLVACVEDMVTLPTVINTTLPVTDPNDTDPKLAYVLTDPQQLVDDGNGGQEPLIVGTVTDGTTQFDVNEFAALGEEICVTGVVYDLRNIQRIIDSIEPDNPDGNFNCCSALAVTIGHQVCNELCSPPEQNICTESDITDIGDVLTVIAALGSRDSLGVYSTISNINDFNNYISDNGGVLDVVCSNLSSEFPICLATTNTVCYNVRSQLCCPTIYNGPALETEVQCSDNRQAPNLPDEATILSHTDQPNDATVIWNRDPNSLPDEPYSFNGQQTTTTQYIASIACPDDQTIVLDSVYTYEVTVYSAASADFNYYPTNHTVDFVAYLGDETTSYYWELGDGNTVGDPTVSTPNGLQHITHSYNAALDSVLVCLTVQNHCGASYGCKYICLDAKETTTFEKVLSRDEADFFVSNKKHKIALHESGVILAGNDLSRINHIGELVDYKVLKDEANEKKIVTAIQRLNDNWLLGLNNGYIEVDENFNIFHVKNYKISNEYVIDLSDMIVGIDEKKFFSFHVYKIDDGISRLWGSILVKVDVLGETLWTKFYRDIYWNSFGKQPINSISLVVHGGSFIQGGRILSSINKEDGSFIWSKYYDDTQIDDFVVLEDGNIVVLGTSTGMIRDLKISKLYNTGEVSWCKSYNVLSSWFTYNNSINVSENENFIIGCIINENYYNYNSWCVVEVNGEGNYLWSRHRYLPPMMPNKRIGGASPYNFDVLYDVVNRNYFFSMQNISYLSPFGEYQHTILKMNKNGMINCQPPDTLIAPITVQDASITIKDTIFPTVEPLNITVSSDAIFTWETHTFDPDSMVCIDGGCTVQFEKPTQFYCPSQTITFPNTSSGTNQYQWYINDSLVATTEDLTHAFDSTGTYIIRLVAGDGADCSGEYQDTITIYPLATSVDLGGDALVVCGAASANPITLDAGEGYAHYIWMREDEDGNVSLVGTDQTQLVNQSGKYIVGVTQHCDHITPITYTDTIVVFFDDDCVWAGDFNGDGIVDMNDLLSWGQVANDITGPARPFAIMHPDSAFYWRGQACLPWEGTHPTTGINLKWLDGNGDGIKTNDDVQAIVVNFHKTHNGTMATRLANGSSSLRLRPVPSTIPFLNNRLFFDIILEDTASIDNLVSQAYGVHFEAQYTRVFANNQVVGAIVEFNNSWLGRENTNLLGLFKDFNADSTLYVGMTRTDQLHAEGKGAICTVGCILDIDVVDARLDHPSEFRLPNATEYFPLVFEFQQAKVIAKDGTVLPTQTVNDTVWVLPAPRVKAKICLEGAYDAAIQQMTTTLNTNQELPTEHPFHSAPWHYSDSVQFVREQLPADIVDWVLVEFRDATNPNIILAQKPALVKADGTLIDAAFLDTGEVIEGVSIGNIDTPPNEAYYLVIKHRNHIGVMSKEAVVFPNDIAYDFTNPNNVAGGAAQLKDLGNGGYGLAAGDFNGDGIINVQDFNAYHKALEQDANNPYSNCDADLNGRLTVDDFNKYQGNSSRIGIAPVRL